MSAKVLLVEDDNNLREIFEMRLQAEGYQTLTASDGEEALVVALKEKPDLIVADIMMPKMSGFEMLETLRAAPDMNKTKVIMMTALGQAEDQTRGEKLGVVKYLVKSQVTLEDFVRVVKEVVPAGDSGGSAQDASDDQATNKESEGNMPPSDTNAPTNPPAGDAPADDTNPITEPAAPASDEGSVAPTSDPSMPANPPGPAPDAPSPPPTDSPMPEPPVTPPSDNPPAEGPSTPAGGM